MRQVDYEISGMHCGSCAARVQAGLAKIPGVVEANVNFATRKARVRGEFDDTAVREAVESLGYGVVDRKPTEEPAEQEAQAMRRQWQELLVAITLTLPVFVLGMTHLEFPGSAFIQLVLTALVILFPGRHIVMRTLKLARHGGVNMDTLITVGVGAAFLYSLAALARGSHDIYFETAAVITTLVLLGNYLEAKARYRASESIRRLAGLRPKSVRIVFADGSEQEVPIESLEPGDLFVVRPGERVATDGVVESGESHVDNSMMTGEPLPVPVAPGAGVIGATVNKGPGRLLVRAEKTGEATALAQIMKLVEDAQASKANVQRLADKVSAIFVPAVILVALMTLLIWVFGLGATFAAGLIPAVAVLVIACPCALGLATPTAIMAGTGRAAERHILIRSAPALEKAEAITVCVMDKTGTLTQGKPVVSSVSPAEGVTDAELLATAAGLESGSQHPLAQAIEDAARERSVAPVSVRSHREQAGGGVSGELAIGERVVQAAVGRWDFVSRLASLKGPEKAPESGTTVHVVAGDRYLGSLTIEDEVRPTSRDAVARLKALGIRCVMATGDTSNAARAVATEVGIDEVHAGLSPADKTRLVEAFQQKGETVAMIGDGINDAPALAQADVGIALGSGTDIAMGAASLVLPHGDLARVADAIALSKATMRVVKQNLTWAFLYNVLAIPLAAAGLLSPMIAAGAMALSSVSVVGNSLRLRHQ